jgi:hypothetical protein
LKIIPRNISLLVMWGLFLKPCESMKLLHVILFFFEFHLFYELLNVLVNS